MLKFLKFLFPFTNNATNSVNCFFDFCFSGINQQTIFGWMDFYPHR